MRQCIMRLNIRRFKGFCCDVVIPMKLQLEWTAWLVCAYKQTYCHVLSIFSITKTTVWLTARGATCCSLQDVIGIKALVPIMSLPVLLLLLLLGQLSTVSLRLGGVGKLRIYVTIYLKTYYTHLLRPAHAAWPWHGARYVLNQLYILYCTAALSVQLTSCMYSASNSSPFE